MKYSKVKVDRITSHIKAGHTAKDACILADITEETFYAWKREKPEFSESLEKAKIRCKESFMKTIQDSDNWRAHAWWLEHRYPKEFSLTRFYEEGQDEPKFTGLTEEQKKKIDEFDEYERHRCRYLHGTSNAGANDAK